MADILGRRVVRQQGFMIAVNRDRPANDGPDDDEWGCLEIEYAIVTEIFGDNVSS